MNYWLLKSDISDYPITQLKKDKKTFWTGVRNYQARNYMTQGMEVGDMCVFYYSGSDSPGVAGECVVTAPAQPDPTQFKRDDSHFDPKASPGKPIWFCVEVGKVHIYQNFTPLSTLRKTPQLSDMLTLRPGNRLSITPLTREEYRTISALGSAHT